MQNRQTTHKKGKTNHLPLATVKFTPTIFLFVAFKPSYYNKLIMYRVQRLEGALLQVALIYVNLLVSCLFVV